MPRYRVKYNVTRVETYEIEAANEDDAKERAFPEGEYLEDGEASDAEPFEIEEVLEK